MLYLNQRGGVIIARESAIMPSVVAVDDVHGDGVAVEEVEFIWLGRVF